MSSPQTVSMTASFGRIGPNAVIRIAEALRALEGHESLELVFQAAGLVRYLIKLPEEMIDEREVARLHRALYDVLGSDRARVVNAAAGRLTADYLMRHRIPALAQGVLRRLPCRLASRLLSNAIAGHAWTFAGTGMFAVRHGRPTTFEITGCPICRGQTMRGAVCDFYAGTFERLFSCLVHRDACAVEVACGAKGDIACRFEVRW
jgi:divinyl protochlorophyllide a 8-vinyl-reductase